MTNPKLLVLTALHNESKAIKAAIPTSTSQNVQFRTIGIRAARLPDLAPLQPIRCIILAGLAGALDPSLQIGDIIVDCDESFPWNTRSLRRGNIHSSVALVTTPDAKKLLFAQTGAAAVDMEQSLVRAAARSLAIPFIGIRSVSDTAEDELDPMILHWIDQMGTPRPAVIARDMLLRPRSWPIARRLARNSKHALSTLAQAVAAIAQAIP